MNTKSTAVSLLILVAIIAVINYLVGGLGFLNHRFDLTEKKLYTLSDGTWNIIKGISAEKPVTIRFYATRDSRLMPQFVQAYATTVEDLLLEFEKASDGKITLEKIDPRPDSESEDKARGDDIAGHPVNAEDDKVYFGLAIQSAALKEVIPSLDPNDEAALEYKVSRAIAKVSKTKRQTVGVMSSMPIAGPAMMLPPQMQQNQSPPWLVINQLRLDYDVREVPMTAAKIDADINILLIIHPAGITDRAEFAIDQYVLGGGKVLAFVDPQCLVSQQYNKQGQMGMSAPMTTLPSSNLKNLFKAWGIGYDADMVVADMTYRSKAQGRTIPTFLTVDQSGISKSDQVTAPLQLVQMFSTGAFNIESKEGLKALPLIESSENNELIDSAAAEKSRREPMNTFQASGKKRTLGLRLSGKFKSAFPDGPPAETNPADKMPKLPGGLQGGGETNDAGAPPAAAKAEAPKPASLKESQNGDGIVFLFADVDMLYDAFCFEQSQMGLAMRNSNVPLLLNAVEMLSGGADLISVRSRGATKRAFTKMQELSNNVEKEYRPRIQQLTDKLNEIAQKISTLRVRQDKNGQMVILDPSQKKDLDEAMETQNSINKQIRDIRKEQNKGKDRVEMWITLLNFLIMPLAVIGFGIALAVKRRSLRAAH